jgi:hypothetical protein
VAVDWFTERNIRAAAMRTYDKVMLMTPVEDRAWFTHGPLTPEKREKLIAALRATCGGCDMTQHLDDIWARINRLMQTFGEAK